MCIPLGRSLPRRRGSSSAYDVQYLKRESYLVFSLGATSCYVTDNADLIFLKDGLTLLIRSLVVLIERLSTFAEVRTSVCSLSPSSLIQMSPG